MDNPGVAGVVYSTHRWCCTQRAWLVLRSARTGGVARSAHRWCRKQQGTAGAGHWLKFLRAPLLAPTLCPGRCCRASWPERCWEHASLCRVCGKCSAAASTPEGRGLLCAPLWDEVSTLTWNQKKERAQGSSRPLGRQAEERSTQNERASRPLGLRAFFSRVGHWRILTDSTQCAAVDAARAMQCGPNRMHTCTSCSQVTSTYSPPVFCSPSFGSTCA
mmetsp:Transcript_31711/g.94659  ORF Transcript_31711/g.94659 Transcript_31711/m.94659 type:complete len:218 (+) Transcript_31711:12-665(+)